MFFKIFFKCFLGRSRSPVRYAFDQKCYLLFLFDGLIRVLIGRSFSVQIDRMVRRVNKFTGLIIIEQKLWGLKSP